MATDAVGGHRDPDSPILVHRAFGPVTAPDGIFSSPSGKSSENPTRLNQRCTTVPRHPTSGRGHGGTEFL